MTMLVGNVEQFSRSLDDRSAGLVAKEQRLGRVDVFLANDYIFLQRFESRDRPDEALWYQAI